MPICFSQLQLQFILFNRHEFNTDLLYNSAILGFEKFISVLDALKRVAAVHPELLRQKLQSSRLNFRNQTGVDALLQHCQDIMKAD